MSRNLEQSEILLLEWLGAMGCDEAISSEPANWFERSMRPPAVQKRSASAPHKTERNRTLAPQLQSPSRIPATSNAAIMAPDAAILESRENARNASSLSELEEVVAKFEGCALKATAKNTCFARGSADSLVMFIGEAPGRDEDIQGRPFVGRAGQLLDKMMASIKLDEESAYITNIVYWRPPGNRTPTPQESQICRPFLERQIELVDPQVLVFLGGAAAKQMLNSTQGIMRLRGKWQTYSTENHQYDAISTLHPAYLLRNPAAKKLAWRDMLAIKAALEKQ